MPGAPQSYIVLAHPGPRRQAPDYVPTNVMAGILGGDFASRINMNLREDKGWAYGAGAGIRYSRGTGMFRAAASVRADATKDAVLELYREVQRDRVEPGDRGRAAAREERRGAGAAGRIRHRREHPRHLPRPDLLRPAAWTTTPPSRRRWAPSRSAQVAAAAKEHLHPEQLHVLVVGDAKTQLPGLREAVAAGALGAAGTVVELDADGQPKAASPAGAAG